MAMAWGTLQQLRKDARRCKQDSLDSDCSNQLCMAADAFASPLVSFHRGLVETHDILLAQALQLLHRSTESMVLGFGVKLAPA